ncbi:hypothetical protein EV672_10970 [Aquabacterium commune]|uniref:Periplasmic binding family protein n=1 Tax=Aquabacterium commune TaxID=70586 RepID=A0A4R6R563_9BURK|nr:hypothetical protein [Aquabacterium commune]TDP81030.1 hypothetical protein EV672_10970 [Aquabacterium commune]
MNFTKIALAVVATVGVAAQAQAATVNLTGASATSLSYVKALKGLCGGTFTVYKTDATATALGNFFTAKCSTNFTGLSNAGGVAVDAVAFNVSGGSFTAVSGSAGNASFAFVPTTGGTATAGTGNLAGVNLQTGVTASLTGQKSVGGFLDIEPTAFPKSELTTAGVVASGLTSKTSAANFSQVFGVAVSNDLYKALQRAQGITAATSTEDDRLPQFQPTISRAQYASIAAETFNSSKEDIGALLGLQAADSADANGNRLLTLCRRASTSGTQAASNQFFLNTFIGTGANGGATNPANAADYAIANSGSTTFDLKEGAGTSNARDCLNADGYGIGVLSLENSPAAAIATGELGGYRFVKLNGVAAYDGVGSVASAKDGTYEFWFQSQKFANNATATAVLNAIDAELNVLTGVTGLFPNAENLFSRNGNNNNIITKQ